MNKKRAAKLRKIANKITPIMAALLQKPVANTAVYSELKRYWKTNGQLPPEIDEYLDMARRME